ncbi:hypothetical protein [Fusibacter bizertensis]
MSNYIKKKVLLSLIVITLVKLIIGIIFIDSAQVESVFNFVSAFHVGTSPWEIFSLNGDYSVFPYPALMLYVYKIMQLILLLFNAAPHWMTNLIYIIPILAADLGCFLVLQKMFPKKSWKIIFFYFLSPVVIYASFFLGHLDLIAIFFLLLSLYFLQKRQYIAMAIALALGFSVKIPMLFALPLVLVYLYRIIQRDRFQIISKSLAAFVGVVFIISAPFTFSLSYIKMVYLNPQQSLLYDLSLNMGNYQLYVAYLAVLVIYARFLMYGKVNKDLLHNFLAVVYSVFVLLVPPSENWYVWSFVLCSVLFISLLDKVKIAYALSALYSVLYLVTFLLAPHITNLQYRNLIFTTFEGVLMFVVYVLYKYGIKSNRVYKKKEHATLIGIGGDSGVGKTTVKMSLVNLLGNDNIVPIESDGDHKWGRGDQSWDKITHLNPKANFLYRQAQYLKALKNGSNIERVEYNHDTGNFTEPLKVYANDFIIVAGLHPFYLPQTRKLTDIKIYLDTQEALRRHWKIRRDVTSRGYSVEQIIAQIEARVEDAQLYIHPQMNYADLVVRFYTDEQFEIGCLTDPKLKLEMMLSLDIDIEGMLEKIESNGYPNTHFYDADMKFQHVLFENEIPKEVIKLMAETFIENIDELINGHEIIWNEGYQGIIQLFTLILLSYHFKKGEEDEL